MMRLTFYCRFQHKRIAMTLNCTLRARSCERDRANVTRRDVRMLHALAFTLNTYMSMAVFF